MNTDEHRNSLQVPRSWHLLLLASCLFIVIAIIFDTAFVEHWFSADGHLTDYGRSYLKVLRIGLLVFAGLCVLLWALRRIITDDFRMTVNRWRKNPSRLNIPDIVPPVKPEGLQKILWVILSLLIFGVPVLMIKYVDYANLVTHEGGMVETITAVCFLVAGFISLKLSIPYFRRNAPLGLLRWWLLGLSVCCLFVAAEESNWGEVYFHFVTGDLIRQVNYQNEISLHNIKIPYVGKHWANRLFEFAAFCGGVLLPLLIRFSKSFRRLIWAAEMPLPPWLSQAYFFVVTILTAIFVKYRAVDLPRANIQQEINECILSVGVVIWLWSILKWQNKKQPEI